jgi:hypothetical protein
MVMKGGDSRVREEEREDERKDERKKNENVERDKLGQCNRGASRPGRDRPEINVLRCII